MKTVGHGVCLNAKRQRETPVLNEPGESARAVESERMMMVMRGGAMLVMVSGRCSQSSWIDHGEDEFRVRKVLEVAKILVGIRVRAFLVVELDVNFAACDQLARADEVRPREVDLVCVDVEISEPLVSVTESHELREIVEPQVKRPQVFEGRECAAFDAC